MADRIHKVLANAGYGSRRDIETLIRNGKISVNGELAVIGQCINEKDKVAINSRLVRLHLQRKKKPKVLVNFFLYRPNFYNCRLNRLPYFY